MSTYQKEEDGSLLPEEEAFINQAVSECLALKKAGHTKEQVIKMAEDRFEKSFDGHREANAICNALRAIGIPEERIRAAFRKQWMEDMMTVLNEIYKKEDA